MPWPAALTHLLAHPDTPAGQAVRWGLQGLRGVLRAALEEAPEGDGSVQAREALVEVEALLGSGNVLPLPTGATPRAAPRLLPLADLITGDARLREELPRLTIRTENDEVIWNDVQRCFLRLSPGAARGWRGRSVELAGRAGARVDEDRAVVLPLGTDEVIYPGLRGSVEANGLRSAQSAPVDPRIGSPAEGDLSLLAGILSACLWFTENDPSLCHCLKGVFMFGIVPLADDQREHYQAELLRRWERVRSGAGAGSRELLKRWLDLDEAIQSLVYQPVAVAQSWWGELQGQVRAAVFRARDRAAGTGCQAHLQQLGGPFASISRLAPDSLQVDFGAPGEVAACLRLWARVDGEEIKGRALYRSPDEEG